MLRRKSKIHQSVQDIPLALRAADGMLLHSFASEVVGSIRHMETTLTSNSDLPGRIAIVSALGGEGVTYITLALATTLASDLAVRVCAVELNWWSPGMHKRLSEPFITPRRRWPRRSVPVPTNTLDCGPGLAGVLQGTATIDEALIPTALPNLSLLPAGDLAPERRPAMARSDALRHCIEQLSRRFDHLLLDIPALLSTSDAIALASLGAGCCVVIRQGVTPITSVRRALDDIKHLQMLGVVLNQARTSLPRWMYTLIPND